MKTAIIFLVITSFALLGCKKGGCIDPLAVNYSSEADKDNGTCTYHGKVIFWFTPVTAGNLLNASVSTLDFYVDGVLLTSIPVTESSENQPACGSLGTLTVDIGNEQSSNLPYTVMAGGTSLIVQTGYVSLSATTLCSCSLVEIWI